MAQIDPNKSLFGADGPLAGAPKGDEARQAVASLRGYAYQVTVAALAWLELNQDDHLYLEVAEDYVCLCRKEMMKLFGMIFFAAFIGIVIDPTSKR